MAKPNSNLKKQNGAERSLRARCWANGMSVTGLAAKVHRNRSTCYFAWANPDKFPIAYRLILEALGE